MRHDPRRELHFVRPKNTAYATSTLDPVLKERVGVGARKCAKSGWPPNQSDGSPRTPIRRSSTEMGPGFTSVANGRTDMRLDEREGLASPDACSAGEKTAMAPRTDGVDLTLVEAIADAADALARIARLAAPRRLESPTTASSSMIPISEAAWMAATTVRVVRDAIRTGELTAYGRRRDRAVRETDLRAWIAGRRVEPMAGADDLDMERRMRRLERRTRKHDLGPQCTKSNDPR